MVLDAMWLGMDAYIDIFRKLARRRHSFWDVYVLWDNEAIIVDSCQHSDY